MISLRMAMIVGFVVTTGCGPSKSTTSDTSDSNTSDTSGGSDTAGPDPCLLEPDPGGCEAAFPKWAFDPQSGECYEWSYGGCDGLIPFETLASCQSMCEPCELFSRGTKPTATEAPVSINVRNNTSEGVWLQTYQENNDAVGFRSQVVQITPEGAQEPFVTAPNECDELYDVTSSDLESCPMGCTDSGPPPGPIYIAAGGMYPTTWDGQYFTKVPLPMRCWAEGCTGDEILAGRWQNVGYETFTASAIVGTVDCFNPDDCVCEPNADGWCSPDILTSLDSQTTVTTNLAWPAQGPIELVVN